MMCLVFSVLWVLGFLIISLVRCLWLQVLGVFDSGCSLNMLRLGLFDRVEMVVQLGRVRVSVRMVKVMWVILVFLVVEFGGFWFGDDLCGIVVQGCDQFVYICYQCVQVVGYVGELWQVVMCESLYWCVCVVQYYVQVGKGVIGVFGGVVQLGGDVGQIGGDVGQCVVQLVQCDLQIGGDWVDFGVDDVVGVFECVVCVVYYWYGLIGQLCQIGLY